MRVFIRFKNDEDMLGFQFIHPMLGIVLFDMALFCYQNNQKFTITSLIRTPKENEAVGAKSMSHVHGRAGDIRVHDWDEFFIKRFKSKFNSKYSNIAAVNFQGQKRFIVDHGNGANRHLHIQLHSSFSIDDAYKYKEDKIQLPGLAIKKRCALLKE